MIMFPFPLFSLTSSRGRHDEFHYLLGVAIFKQLDPPVPEQGMGQSICGPNLSISDMLL